MGGKVRNNRKRLALAMRQAVKAGGPDSLLWIVPCPLCLRAVPLHLINEEDSSGLKIMTIEHAPQLSHSAGGVERCLTCRRCNNELGHERRVGIIRVERARLLSRPRSEIAALTLEERRGLLPLASISDDERLFELKTAYLIAYATLGPKLLFSSRLAEVRQAILDERAPAHVCGTSDDVRLRSLPDAVMLTRGPQPGIGVTVPSNHPERGANERHVVFLPSPWSSDGFYDAVESYEHTIGVGRIFEVPREREMTRALDLIRDVPEERWTVNFDVDFNDLCRDQRVWLDANPEMETKLQQLTSPDFLHSSDGDIVPD